MSARQISLQGMAAVQNGQWEHAEALFHEATVICPVDERARCHLAEALWHRGACEPAIEQLEEAVRLSGGHAELTVRLGEMYLAVGDLPKALDRATRAIQHQPQLASAHALEAAVLHRIGRVNEALASYHRALRIRNHYPEVQLAVAGIYQHQGRPQRALSTLEELERFYAPDQRPASLLFLKGIALKSLGRYHDAAENLVGATAQLATVEGLYQLGEARWLAGDATNAKLSLQAALEQDPRHFASRQLLARIESQRQGIAALVDR